MTSEALIGDRSAGVQRDRRTLAFTWLVTLILSSLPAIIAVELAGVRPAAAHWSTLAAAMFPGLRNASVGVIRRPFTRRTATATATRRKIILRGKM